jgi:hypothetical protein
MKLKESLEEYKAEITACTVPAEYDVFRFDGGVE